MSSERLMYVQFTSSVYGAGSKIYSKEECKLFFANSIWGINNSNFQRITSTSYQKAATKYTQEGTEIKKIKQEIKNGKESTYNNKMEHLKCNMS